MQYNKPAVSIEQQIEKLESRGLKFHDRERARSYLSNISYYRLSAYSLPFQKKNSENHEFKQGVYFEQILDLYLFDREFRFLIFDAIEKLEVAFRTQIIYHFSILNNAWWFQDSNNFINNSYFQSNLDSIDKEIQRSNETFIDHYKTNTLHLRDLQLG